MNIEYHPQYTHYICEGSVQQKKKLYMLFCCAMVHQSNSVCHSDFFVVGFFLLVVTLHFQRIIIRQFNKPMLILMHYAYDYTVYNYENRPILHH